MKKHVEEQKSMIKMIAEFLLAKRIPLITFVSIMILGIIIFFIADKLNVNIKEKSSLEKEKFEELYNEWQITSDLAKKTELEKTITVGLDGIIKKYGSNAAVQWSYYIKGEMAYKNADYEAALGFYTDLVKKIPSSYLAADSLFFAGNCAERLGKPDKALEYYEKLVKNYGDSALIPNTYFSLGRLHEDKTEYAQAMHNYEILSEKYDESNWTKLAKNRIIALKSSGVVQ